ncbi:MAG TPA: MarR family transcriptional regulator [Anaerolineales bacterium]|nr:MarR family transcriptional regulator [Anaerolineales bacterium]
MSTERTAEQFMDLIKRYMSLRPKLILPEHVIEFKKKIQALRSSGYQFGDHAFVFRILILLSQNAEPLTMSELSSELDVPMSTATRIVDGLVRGGMAERVNDPNDRRVVRVGMSKNGRELHEAGMAYNKQRIAKLLKDFTAEEQAQLLNLMNKLFDALLNEK